MATPNTLNSISDRVAKMENTATMITAALVTTPALRAMPSVIAARVDAPPSRSSLIRLEDEHVVVHAQPEQQHEHEQRQPGRDPAVGGEAEHPLQVTVLEDQTIRP